MEYKKQSTFPLRLPRTMRIVANELANREGLSLNQFISLAVAEKITRLEQFPWPEGGNTDETPDTHEKR